MQIARKALWVFHSLLMVMGLIRKKRVALTRPVCYCRQLLCGNQSKGTRYFHIPLKLVGDAGNVASNKFFKVSATITGEGSPNPDEILENACINFSIEVAPWNVVEQTEDDTN